MLFCLVLINRLLPSHGQLCYLLLRFERGTNHLKLILPLSLSLYLSLSLTQSHPFSSTPMSSLSISLDNEPIGMEPMFLKGTLLLHQNEANSLVVAGETCLLQVVGTFDQHEIVVSSHTLPLTPHMNFDIPLDLDYEGLAYSVRACIRDSRKGLTLNVARPLNLDFQSPPPPTSYPSSFCSSSSASSLSIASSIPCSRLCWGMSAQSQWRYELELPQRIEDSGFQITLRTQFRSTPQPLETCLIGVRVYDSAQ